tara:strand:- start:229 stop:507 length:279 start_codon:yes stop_codon:yes gene_type:complete
MSKKVFLYTMDGCPFCQEVKGLLKEAEIKFIERDCDDYEMQYEILKENTNNNEFVPAFEIRDSDNMTKRFLVPDRDFEELEHAVYLIKNQLQ